MINLDISINRIELEGIVNVDIIKEEIEENKLSKDNIDDDEVNQYHNIITDNIDREYIVITNGTMVNT